jgi:hypothetical protein
MQQTEICCLDIYSIRRLRAGRSGIRLPAGTRVFSPYPTHLGRHWGLPNLLCSGCWCLLRQSLEGPGREVNHSTRSSPKVELYIRHGGSRSDFFSVRLYHVFVVIHKIQQHWICTNKLRLLFFTFVGKCVAFGCDVCPYRCSRWPQNMLFLHSWWAWYSEEGKYWMVHNE